MIAINSAPTSSNPTAVAWLLFPPPTPNPLINDLQPHPLRWVGLPYLSSFKNKRPMERSPWALKPFTNPNQEVF